MLAAAMKLFSKHTNVNSELLALQRAAFCVLFMYFFAPVLILEQVEIAGVST